jgi:hypothetical protein
MALKGVEALSDWLKFHNNGSASEPCSSKAKMSALSKVEMSVSAPFWSSEVVISMGMVVMSKRELNRFDVLARLDSERLTA